MADDVDIANENAQRHLEQQLASYCASGALPLLNECEDCGEPIAPARLKALQQRGCLRCVECQQIFELKQRGTRHG